MKIEFNHDLVEFTPESKDEAAALQKLWDVVLDCNRQNLKLVPVGEFQLGKSTLARFHVEE
ncbi:MAG: hypothetical protein HY905_14995 [Deltaproteobacteria bacterium]|nr:hypothetical protein [Deltaproteobacteria bacterium]